MLHNALAPSLSLAVRTLLPQIDTMFEGLHPRELASLRSIDAESRLCERDMQLVHAGATTPSLLLIQSGWAFRYRLLTDGRRQVLDILLPGDTVGMNSILSVAAGGAIQAATAVRYLCFDHSQIAPLAAQPWFRQRMLEKLLHERVASDTAITRLGQGRAEERIASVLLELYDRLARRNLARSGCFTLGLTQQHLSDLLGLTPVHLGRVMHRLRDQGLLSVIGREVKLIDIPGLERLAPF